jgi:M6 family metalloprotease-like protein
VRHARASLTAENLFTPLKTATSYVVQNREAIRAAIAAGMSLASFDDDGNGVVTDDEMQVFLIGASPTTSGGAGTRGIGSYTPPGSAISVNLNGIVGAGEDLSFATIVHELSHCLGVGYELYGAAAINQNVAIMGATIYSNADDRQTYLHDPWTRMRFGWLHPRIFSLTDAGASTLLEVSDAYPETINKRPVLLVDPLHFNFSTGEGEYFMLEYRNPMLSATSYDTNSAAKGLYIWHCNTGPGGTNVVIPSTSGACCSGTSCYMTWQAVCPGTSVFKGVGVACAANSTCPAGSPAPTAIDGSINTQGPYTPSGGGPLQYLRGTGAPWTLGNTPTNGIVPKYLDGSDAAVRIRVGNPTADGRSLPVEWSYSGSLPERIDSLERYRFRRMSNQTIRGMFGTRITNLNIHTTGGTYVGELGFNAQTPTQITGVYAPATFPTGTYYLTAQVGAFAGNQIQVQITPRSDWNEDGVLSVQDIFDFLADWFAGTGDYSYPWDVLSVQDIFDFLGDWFAGI